MPTKIVIGTSLYQIMFITAFTTFMHATQNKTVDLLLALILIMGGVLGALYTANGLGGLIGPPALGALIDSSGYLFAQIIAGATAAIGALILLFLPKSADSARS